MTRLALDIRPQPDDTTCGPTCLHAVYRYFGEDLSLTRVIREVLALEEGGTLAVFLACHALRRGYRATIYTYNLHVFDPTWFQPRGPDIRERLKAQWEVKRSRKLRQASEAYIEFLDLGGSLRFADLTPGLLRGYLEQGLPILTGLNATFLYRCARERMEGDVLLSDDVRGEPTGHFVVVHGYDRKTRKVSIADPLPSNPLARHSYHVGLDRLVCAIMLGIVTYDANLLVIEPPSRRDRVPRARSRRRAETRLKRAESRLKRARS